MLAPPEGQHTHTHTGHTLNRSVAAALTQDTEEIPLKYSNVALKHALTLRKYLMFLLWKSPGGSNRYRSSSHKSRRKPGSTHQTRVFTRDGQQVCVGGKTIKKKKKRAPTFLILTRRAHHVPANLPLQLHFSLKEGVQQLLGDVPCSQTSPLSLTAAAPARRAATVY